MINERPKTKINFITRRCTATENYELVKKLIPKFKVAFPDARLIREILGENTDVFVYSLEEGLATISQEYITAVRYERRDESGYVSDGQYNPEYHWEDKIVEYPIYSRGDIRLAEITINGTETCVRRAQSKLEKLFRRK